MVDALNQIKELTKDYNFLVLQSGINAQAMAVAVAIGCSAAFLTPIAHPVNVLRLTYLINRRRPSRPDNN